MNTEHVCERPTVENQLEVVTDILQELVRHFHMFVNVENSVPRVDFQALKLCDTYQTFLKKVALFQRVSSTTRILEYLNF
jgi:hypothetical protein